MRRALASTCVGRRAMSTLSGADPTQAALMRERVILVSPEDKVLGSATKHAAHLVSTGLPLHRAFSVFLFDSQNRLLVQQRAPEKVTYSHFWANACCSHPLFCTPELGIGPEEDPEKGLGVVGGERAVHGAKVAAVRKLSHELGIAPGAIGVEDLEFLTRVHYRDVCADGVWGEHELDYILFVRKDVKLDPNMNEIGAVRWCKEEDLRDMFRSPLAHTLHQEGSAVDDKQSNGGTVDETIDPRKTHLISPWFRYIMDAFGWTWWKQLRDVGPKGVLALSDSDIHAFGECRDGVSYKFVPTAEHPC